MLHVEAHILYVIDGRYRSTLFKSIKGYRRTVGATVRFAGLSVGEENTLRMAEGGLRCEDDSSVCLVVTDSNYGRC